MSIAFLPVAYPKKPGARTSIPEDMTKAEFEAFLSPG